MAQIREAKQEARDSPRCNKFLCVTTPWNTTIRDDLLCHIVKLLLKSLLCTLIANQLRRIANGRSRNLYLLGYLLDIQNCGRSQQNLDKTMGCNNSSW